jgi:hypothetical protein
MIRNACCSASCLTGYRLQHTTGLHSMTMAILCASELTPAPTFCAPCNGATAAHHAGATPNTVSTQPSLAQHKRHDTPEHPACLLQLLNADHPAQQYPSTPHGLPAYNSMRKQELLSAVPPHLATTVSSCCPQLWLSCVCRPQQNPAGPLASAPCSAASCCSCSADSNHPVLLEAKRPLLLTQSAP